ncbi:FYN-binding protein 2 [Varanus komodoensis]|uniref:FYN-binding protein 2 n=1 Tax=Varanus komodoensis TaxID=61221 RepID=UPI001CF7A415|nr:FYN-binding protein 2 [Varanus komodoensis]
MEMERIGDFRALRAKFQNDSNFSSALLHSAKKSTAEIIPQQNTDGSSTTCSKPKALRQVQIPVPGQKTEQFSYTFQKPDFTDIKPTVLPRVRIRELSEVGKSEDRKRTSIAETLCGRTVSVVDSQRQCPVPCCHTQETALAKNSFHDTLQIWENAVSPNEQKCSATPPQPASRTISLARQRTADVAVSKEVKTNMAEKEQSLALSAPRTPSHLQSEPISFPSFTPPVPPRGQMRLERVAHGAIHIASALSPNGYDLNRPNKTSQSTTEKLHANEKIKHPNTKPLPSLILLGPPPKKPPRPPTVDLGIFQRKLPAAVDDAYMTPEITETEGLIMYDETIPYLKQPESSKSSGQEPAHFSKGAIKEDSKIDDQEDKSKFSGECRGEKSMSQEGTAQTNLGTGLENDGNYGYVCLETLRIDEEKESIGLRASRLEQPMAEVYDDVEGLQRELQASEASHTFTSDTCKYATYEETYEDVQSEAYNSVKSNDVRTEKLKGFGNFFKKGKYKMKNSHLKENFRNLSQSVPNLDVVAREHMLYDDVDTEKNDTSISSRHFFKVKKFNLEKTNKMAKEEKLFREKFMYTKEITVINTAVAHCSNTLTKGKLDLKITAGEQVDVIDITEGNQLICRNSEGKYGYVLLEHLNFR